MTLYTYDNDILDQTANMMSEVCKDTEIELQDCRIEHKNTSEFTAYDIIEDNLKNCRIERQTIQTRKG